MSSILLLWLLTPWAISFLHEDMPSKGQFGDLFGSINSLFSGLGLGGIIYTIILQQSQLKIQREELSLQRNELELQREEMKGSRAELKNQVSMQHALIMATIAQVNVAAVNAQIEAIKLESEAQSLSERKSQSDIIREGAKTLGELADQLKERTPKIA